MGTIALSSLALQHRVGKLLELHEGRRKFPYTDTVGKLTIGVGFNLDDVGLDNEEIDFILNHRIEKAYQELCSYPVFVELDDARQAVLIDMYYNLGITRLRGFKKFWRALRDEDYVLAAREMLASRWAVQVGKRAHRLAHIMEHGNIEEALKVWPP